MDLPALPRTIQRSALYRRRKLVVLTALASVVCALLPISFFVWLSWDHARQHQIQQMDLITEMAAQQSEKIFEEAHHWLRRLAGSGHPIDSEAFRELLRQAAFESDYVREFGAMTGEDSRTLVVTSFGVIDPPRRIFIDPWPMPSKGIAIIPPHMTLHSDNERSIIVNHAQFDALIDPVHLKNTLSALSAQQSIDFLAVLEATGRQPLAVYRSVPEGVLNDVQIDGAANTLRRQGDMLVAYRQSEKYPLLIVAGSKTLNLSFSWKALSIWLVGFGLLSSLGAVLLVLFMAGRRLSPIGELESALRKNEFIAHYMPAIEISTGRCIGAEALARWRAPDGSILPPSMFITLAESTGLIEVLTEQVVHRVIEDMGDELRARKMRISINLSSVNFRDNRIFSTIVKSFQDADIPPDSVIFEVTERDIIDVDSAGHIVKQLREIGYKVGLDDFGTGYATLRYLQELQLDFLKIDQMFVRAMQHDAVSSQIVDSIIDMADKLGLAVVAEGIETQAQVDELQKMGVDHVQGFLFSKPLPVNMMKLFLKKYPRYPKPGSVNRHGKSDERSSLPHNTDRLHRLR